MDEQILAKEIAEQVVPDETTLCRFRNRLVANNKLEGLLAAINEQIQSHGLMVKGARGSNRCHLD
ncbi:hypothetical protein [Nitrosomonas sp. HPC101]|uniref:hypothetical protein n=1 Tax=Nitrosomonas sp. HPC101 TaxID=1658667 RepID=UPI001F03D47F|nr:hypothetical protein [Nitrosomonas sp. HPC101]